MSSVLDVPVSVFRGVQTDTPCETPLLSDMLTRIGQGVYRGEIAHLRRILTEQGEKAYKRTQERLLAMTPACTLRTRDRKIPVQDKVVQVTNIVHYDLDNLADHEAVKAQLRTHPSVAFVFTSPRGNGLKIGVAASSITTQNYKRAWETILRELKQHVADGTFIEDKGIKYVNALCFISDDAGLYMNPQAVPIQVPTVGPDDEDPPLEMPAADATDFNLALITDALTHTPSDDYTDWITVGQGLHATGHALARGLWDWWSATSRSYNAAVQEAKWAGFTQDGGRHLGDVYTVAHRHGWRPAGWGQVTTNGTAELRSQTQHATTQDVTTGKSIRNDLGSQKPQRSLDVWPTLRKEALSGLAGTIVRTIARYSEAAHVALLGQLLTYFGVVTGRSPFFAVEATRHHTNLFAALVGETSRGRKGTSYDHIERLFLEADTTWTQNNITGSCGSGEGLIAAVRDAVHKRESVKENGHHVEYQEVETNPGVTDKRLLVYEAEFSSLLKVASREGNILSETLRKAWDTGYLRNPVKVAPLKATGAHIAIAGHITVTDLQRALTTTEAGNGFGNRFLWLCVKRARVLPEGGAPPAKVLDPLVAQLTHAVETAKTVTEMRRDDAARVAWRAVYEPLTTDYPGMAGTLLARAEAQVVRLSMLYALLDGSSIITLAHLNAALALWEYCEASVRYLFSSSMGDTDADTLLANLQDCAPKGLSRKQILHSVFQRHLRADQLDRVVRLLEERKLLRVEHEARTMGYGRGRDMYYAIDSDLSDFSDPSSRDYVSISNDAVKQAELRSHAKNPVSDLSSADTPPAFTALGASELWCPACQTARPVALTGRAYRCTACGEIAGYRADDNEEEPTSPAPCDHTVLTPGDAGPTCGELLAAPGTGPAPPADPDHPQPGAAPDAPRKQRRGTL
jgi:hypothetical protein